MKKIILKRIACVLLCLVLAISMTACGSSKTESAQQTVKIGLLSIDDSLPFFMAEKLGLYEKRNVSVELVQFGSANDKETALEAGAIDGDMTDLIVTALLKKGGLDVKIVSIALGAKTEEGRFDILGAPGCGISSPIELAGIEVAVGDNTIVHYLSDTIQEKAGVPADQILSQNIPSLSLRFESLMNGSVKAAVLPDPLASLAVMQGAELIYDDTLGTENLSQSIVLFTQEALDSKSDEIALVMDACFEAMEYINNNPDAEYVRNAIREFSSVPDAIFDSYSTPKYTARALPDKIVFEDVMDWMVENQLLETAYSYDDMVDNRYAK